MNAKIEQAILSLVEARANAQPTAMEFEFGYQVRVACDRIRFAIKQVESRGPKTDLQQACLELLDALERLESTEKQFRVRSRRITSLNFQGNGCRV